MLLASARKRGKVTYGRLMKVFKLSRGRVLTRLIEDVDRREHRTCAPGFAAIIVRKDTGYPGGGYFCGSDVPPRIRRPAMSSADPRLSDREREYVREQQRRLWAYYGRLKRKRGR